MFNPLYSFLVSANPPQQCNIVKKRHDNLDQQGDACFSLDMAIWGRYMDNRDNQGKLEFSDQDLIDSSQEWSLPIRRVVMEENNCRLYFDRPECLRKYFQKVQEEDPNHNVIIEDAPVDMDIDTYRRRVVNNSLSRLVSIRNSECTPETLKIGSCFDSFTKKPFPLTYLEYLAKRSTDMQLIAQHKYGLRVQNEKYLRDLVNILGSSAVIVDLLEAKTSGPVFLSAKSNTMAHTSSKGASFILYNSARIETLFRVFEERMQSGYYPPLPDIIDWSLLKEEDEWKLFYNYLVEYDHVLDRTIRTREIHNLCGFLYKLVGHFSVYYRRTRILTVRLIDVLVT